MATTLYINVKIDLFLKINLTIERLSTKKMISRRHFISQGPYFKNLKHEKEHTKNFRSKSISFMITLLYTGTEACIFGIDSMSKNCIIQINQKRISF